MTLLENERETTAAYLRERALQYLCHRPDEVSQQEMLLQMYKMSRDDDLVLGTMRSLILSGDVVVRITSNDRFLLPMHRG